MTTADMSLVAKESILVEKLKKKTCRLNFFVRYCKYTNTCSYCYCMSKVVEKLKNYMPAQFFCPILYIEVHTYVHTTYVNNLIFLLPTYVIEHLTYLTPNTACLYILYFYFQNFLKLKLKSISTSST